ncbi:MAG: SpoIID/LytB domain-containing protein, partial [Bacillota bacterium]
TYAQAEAQTLTNQLTNAGMQAFLTFTGDGFTVYAVGQNANLIQKNTGKTGSSLGQVSAYKVTGANGTVLIPINSSGVLQGSHEENTFSIGQSSTRYRGYLTFDVAGGALTPVNAIGIDTYLYGVVPAEMPPSYHEEALKAQAIAARTYVLTKMGEHSAGEYHLCDSVHCQVYHGVSVEQATTTKAVDSTSGTIILYDGEPIEAVFSAASGGYTENSEDVWSDEVPYLKAVPEIAPELDTAWSGSVSASQLSAVAGFQVSDIVITKLATGGRVQELKLVGGGTKVLSGDSLRSFFSGTNLGTLPSKMFTINGKGGTIGQYDGAFLGISSSAVTLVSNEAMAVEEEVAEALKEEEIEALPAEGKYHFPNTVSAGITLKTEGTLSHLDGLHIDFSESDIEDIVGDFDFSSVKDDEIVEEEETEEEEEVEPEEPEVSLPSFDTANRPDYSIASVNISTSNGSGNFNFSGYGNGHGVGMSQKGAEAMAKLGYSYQQILTHYYTGVTIGHF